MWNAKTVALLEKLWSEGRSAGHIAAQLDCSRSAVCAKLQRLGLKRGRKPPTAKPAIVSRPRRRTVSRARKSGSTNVEAEKRIGQEVPLPAHLSALPLRPLHKVVPQRKPTGQPVQFTKSQLRAMLAEAVRNTI